MCKGSGYYFYCYDNDTIGYGCSGNGETHCTKSLDPREGDGWERGDHSNNDDDEVVVENNLHYDNDDVDDINMLRGLVVLGVVIFTECEIYELCDNDTDYCSGGVELFY